MNERYAAVPDYHLHTAFSGDCKTPPEELILQAISQGMTSLCVTDHNDLDHPVLPDPVDFHLDTEVYIKSMLSLREKYKDRFDLRIGVEQGVMPETCEKLSDFSLRYPELDFIICSSHFVEGYDPYYPPYFEKYDEKTGYRKYFETILYNVTHFEDYHVYGHLDYILRYGPTKAEFFTAKDYLEIFEEAFKVMIEKGKGIEINTGSLYRGMDFAHPHREILQLYHDMGGEVLTFGSDSHDLVHIGWAFPDAVKEALETGFRYYTTFRRGKPEFHPLENEKFM